MFYVIYKYIYYQYTQIRGSILNFAYTIKIFYDLKLIKLNLRHFKTFEKLQGVCLVSEHTYNAQK